MGKEGAMDVFQLLVSGARFKMQGPVEGTQKADVYEGPDFNVTFSADGNELEVSGLMLYVRGPDAFRLQALVMGIASDLEGDLVYRKYKIPALTKLAINWGNRAFMLFMMALLLIGNSDFHSGRAWLWLPLSFLVSLLFLLFLVVIKFDNGKELFPIEPGQEGWSKGFWYAIAFSLMLAMYCLAEIGRRCGDKAKILRPLRPHAAKRRDAYFEYCQNLWRKGGPTHELRSELLRAERGELTISLQRRAHLEREIKKQVMAERSYIYQLKSVIRCVRGKETQAFFFPIRVWVALMISMFLAVTFILQFVSGLQSIERGLQNLDVKSLELIDQMVLKLQGLYLEITGDDLPEGAIAWTIKSKEELHMRVVQLAAAFNRGYIGASVVAGLLILLGWSDVVLDLRCEVLQARRGIWQFNVRKMQSTFAWTYVGTQVSNAMFTYALISIPLTIVFTVLGWPVTWDLIIWFLTHYIGFIITLAVSPLVNIVLKMILKKSSYDTKTKTIKNRFCFMGFDLLQLMVMIITSITSALVRFALVVVISLFSLTRVTKSPMPAWLEEYLLLDTGSKSFQGLILLTHCNNHPVMRTAVWMMEEDAVRRREYVTVEQGVSKETHGYVSPRKRIISNRFNLWWLLHKNPKLRTYRWDEEVAKAEAAEKAAKAAAKKNKLKKALSMKKKAPEEPATSTADLPAPAKPPKPDAGKAISHC
jgi:hypothetical protein